MSNSSERRGCGPVLVFMIAFFFFLVGLLAGAGGLYAYLYNSENGLEELGIAELATTAPDDDAEDEPSEIYAMAYPLMDTLDVHSSLDEGEIRAYLANEQGVLEQCYEEELERSPATRGEIDLQFSIHGQSGEVVTAVVRDNRTESDDLADCLTRRIRSDWSFDAPDKSGVATVRFHTLFLPLAGD